jgi:SnoaL-like domain
MKRQTPLRIGLAMLSVALAACTSPSLSTADRREIADSLARQVRAAYDLSRPNVEQRMLSLYPPAGPIVSAAAGHMITSRDTLAMGIKAFWDNVGVNMRQPQWIWDQMVVDVLAPNAAVMTATYHIPHLTPQNQPHVIAGAWTAAFEKRGSRWYVVQEHLSDVPAQPDSAAQAAMAAMSPNATMPSTPPRAPKKPN